MDWNNLKGIINAFLHQKKYVLVFDDVWDIQAWQVFRYTFPECNYGSRVMLIRRNANLALLSSREHNGYVYDLQPLSLLDSWALFCKKMFKENYCPSHLEGLLTSNLRRCEGLLLAIVAISGLLSMKDKSSVVEREKTYQSLGAELEGNNQLLSMKKILSLKGFVAVKEKAPTEQVAEGYLNELINKSLIQVAKINGKRRIKLYRILDLWHEIIVFKSKEQNIVTIASERGTRMIIWNIYNKASVSLSNVLDLSGALLKIFPNEVVKLGHLTYLSLKGTEVNKLPKSIGRLKNLEILDLRHTYVTELPDEILNLQRLRHLLPFRYEEKRIIRVRGEDGIALCASLQKLINLYALYVTATEEDEIIDLESLSSPPRLVQTLFVKGRLEKLPHWIPSLHSLVTVCLWWSKLKDADPLQYLQGLPSLVYLNLVEAYEGEELCFKVTLMEGAMPYLKELYIENCRLMEELPLCIEQLMNLTLLDLFDMSDIMVSKLNRDLQGGDY
ncbi:hypothetical protein ACSBR1_038011 [Camellia fascicularis]